MKIDGELQCQLPTSRFDGRRVVSDDTFRDLGGVNMNGILRPRTNWHAIDLSYKTGPFRTAVWYHPGAFDCS